MRSALALLLSLLTAPALAGPRDAEWNPPARYAGSYTGKLIERRLPQHLVVGACNALFAKHRFAAKATLQQRGCSVHVGNTCTIIIIDRRYGLASPEAVRRHELGHCNGWGADHPN